jgi:hypothetical protein
VDEQMSQHSRLLRILDGIHLVYLGLLPALATLSALLAHGHPAPTLLFFGGIVLVSVYLAVVFSYTSPSRSIGIALLTLLDGPIFVALSQLSGGAWVSFAINGFLVDGVAIWLAILWLALTTSLPTQGQRWATVAFGLIAMATMLSTFWPHIRDNVLQAWDVLLWLGVGLIEAVVARHFLLRAGTVARDTDRTTLYIVAMLFAWVAAMIAGNVLYQTTGAAW